MRCKFFFFVSKHNHKNSLSLISFHELAWSSHLDKWFVRSLTNLKNHHLWQFLIRDDLASKSIRYTFLLKWMLLPPQPTGNIIGSKGKSFWRPVVIVRLRDYWDQHITFHMTEFLLKLRKLRNLLYSHLEEILYPPALFWDIATTMWIIVKENCVMIGSGKKPCSEVAFPQDNNRFSLS